MKMGTQNSVSKKAREVRKGAWTGEEDALLRKCMEKYGAVRWSLIPQRAGINRCPKSCRLRWLNYLCPSIKKGKFEEDEVDLIIRLHKLLGNRWSLIAGRLPGRTANDVKNYWNTHLSKQHLLLASKKGKKEVASDCIINTHSVEVVKPQPRTIPVNWSWPMDSDPSFSSKQYRQQQQREEPTIVTQQAAASSSENNTNMDLSTGNLELELQTATADDFGVEDVQVLGDDEFFLEGLGGWEVQMHSNISLWKDFECI